MVEFGQLLGKKRDRLDRNGDANEFEVRGQNALSG